MISKYFLSWKKRLSSSRMRGGNATERGGREKRGFKSEKEIGALSPINQQTSLPSQDGTATAHTARVPTSASGRTVGASAAPVRAGDRAVPPAGQRRPLTELLTLSRGHRLTTSVLTG